MPTRDSMAPRLLLAGLILGCALQALVTAQNSSALPRGLPVGPPGCRPATLAKIAFGVATSAPQIEGAAALDGRSPSVWDVYANPRNGKIVDGTTPAVATDFYHRYKGDIQLMRSMGIKNFRMSISWSRLIPGATKGSPINPKAVKFYNNVFDTLIANGITPAVTLYHWDLPQKLQDDYEGFISPKVQEDFLYYADQAFKTFGGKIKKWTTFNEPWITCNLQWGNGDFAPGKVYGNNGKWKCGHNLLLAHAKAYRLYVDKYKPTQGGVLGMALWSEWTEPWRPGFPGDVRAAQNRMDTDFGWFADPINFGDYPQLIKNDYAAFLPKFTDAEKALLKKSYDYLGITLYTAKYGREDPMKASGYWIMNEGPPPLNKTLGEQAESVWLYNVPWSMERILNYLDKRYGRPEIWMLENGISEKGEANRQGEEVLKDFLRIKYFSGYISEACKVVDKGVRFTHYFAWSFTDNWEWREGFRTKFGTVHVDFKSPGLNRKRKYSAYWLTNHIFRRGTRNVRATEGK